MNLTARRQLHSQTRDQLASELAQAERTLLDLQFDKGLNRLSNPAAMRDTRKQIARLKTLMTEIDLVAEHADLGIGTIAEYRAYKQAERKSFRASRKAR